MSGPPHYAQAYYNKNDQTVLLTAMTDSGFRLLAEALNKYDHYFDDEPAIRLNPSMMIIASDILKREIQLNRYENLFAKEPSSEEKAVSDKLNNFLKLIIPDINAGTEPDIETLASKAGIDVEEARSMYKAVIKKFGGK